MKLLSKTSLAVVVLVSCLQVTTWAANIASVSVLAGTGQPGTAVWGISSQQILVQPFTLQHAASLTSIHVAVSGSGAFKLMIVRSYTDLSQPLFWATFVDPGVQVNGSVVFDPWVDGIVVQSPLILAKGTYYLVVVAFDTTSVGGWAQALNVTMSNVPNQFYCSTDSGTDWTLESQSAGYGALAFQVFGVKVGTAFGS